MSVQLLVGDGDGVGPQQIMSLVLGDADECETRGIVMDVEVGMGLWLRLGWRWVVATGYME